MKPLSSYLDPDLIFQRVVALVPRQGCLFLIHSLLAGDTFVFPAHILLFLPFSHTHLHTLLKSFSLDTCHVFGNGGIIKQGTPETSEYTKSSFQNMLFS